jgi:hypothetical protein
LFSRIIRRHCRLYMSLISELYCFLFFFSLFSRQFKELTYEFYFYYFSYSPRLVWT